LDDLPQDGSGGCSELSAVAACIVRPRIVGEPLRCLQIAAAIVTPSSCVAPSPSRVVRPPASPLCVPVLILESQTVVALTAATAETSLVVVVALVVTSLVVTSLVVAALVEVVSVVEAVGVTIVVATAATIIVVPTKEDPGLSLAFLPFATSAAASTIWKEKPGLSVHLSLPPLPASIDVAAVEAIVVEPIVEAVVVEPIVEAVVVTSIQRVPNCRSEHSGPESSQADPDQTAVKSLVSCEDTRIDIRGWVRICLRRCSSKVCLADTQTDHAGEQ